MWLYFWCRGLPLNIFAFLLFRHFIFFMWHTMSNVSVSLNLCVIVRLLSSLVFMWHCSIIRAFIPLLLLVWFSKSQQQTCDMWHFSGQELFYKNCFSTESLPRYSFLTRTESRSSISPECISCILAWIYQLWPYTPWHLVICDDNHKP